MSNLTDWIKNELYPSIYESIDIAFPELNFSKLSGGWRSSLKIDLTSPKHRRPDKTVVSKKAPGWILEQGGDTLSLVDYVIKRDGVEFIQAVKTLADVVGLQIPRAEFNQESYSSYKDQAAILEDCNSYFIYCLENSPGADPVKAYLSYRGYSDEDVKAMELGYIPDQDKLFKYLLSKGYSQELIDKAVTIKTDTRIGSTHRLTIPYRSGGSIKGFKFRTTTDATPKYLNSTGLDRLGGFFNLSGVKGDKDVVIVEGELDSLSATARGVDNVVATGGSSISPDQVKDAIRKGAKSFTICFDTEPDKEEQTAKNISSAIEVILAEGVNRVYIVNLPDLGGGKTDPDRLIKERGAGAFRDSIKTALSYHKYQLNSIFFKYARIQEESGALTDRDIDRLLDEIVITAHRLQPVDRDLFTREFLTDPGVKELGLSEASLSDTVEKLAVNRDKIAQAAEFKKLLDKAADHHKKGETDKGLELLDEKINEVKQKSKADEFNRLLLPTSEAQMIEDDKNLPDSLNTGYLIDGEELQLPGGAISVIAAPTNHGKTIMLINTMLNIADRYPDKRFVFFTYEERANSIRQYFLNTYIDLELNKSAKTNRRVLREYFKTGSTQFIRSENLDVFKAKKEKFFKTYIETGRIVVKYVDFNSEELTGAIQYLHKTSGDIAGVFIDYFQLLRLPQDKYRNYSSRQEELKQICISLKDTAVKTGLPLCLAAQFNREVTNLMRLHPTHIGEAGDIERIVNTLVGLWNMDKKPVLKGITNEERDEINDKIRHRGLSGDGDKNMYLEILKSRDLPTGSFEFLDFNGNTGKIKNRTIEQHKDIFSMPNGYTVTRIEKSLKEKAEADKIFEKEAKDRRAKDIVDKIRAEIASNLFTDELTEKTILDYLKHKKSGDLIQIVLRMLKPDLKAASIERKANKNSSKNENK